MNSENSSKDQKTDLQILLAEDSILNQKIALHIFQEMGYVPDVVANGLDVIKALVRQDYDIIFMDLLMPEMDGLEVTRTIVENWPAYKRPKIIAMTAYDRQSGREKCLEAGMDGFITKPIKAKEIRSVLEQWGKKMDDSQPRAADTSSQSQIAPILNLDTLAPLQMNKDFFSGLIDTFLEDSLKYVTNIQQAEQKGDVATLVYVAHSLKGASRSLGAENLGNICEQIEIKGKKNELTNIDTLLDQLEKSFNQTCIELKKIAW